MPSTSSKQRKFMAAAAHNSSFAKAAGIPQKVAKEFNRADMVKSARSLGRSNRRSTSQRSSVSKSRQSV